MVSIPNWFWDESEEFSIWPSPVDYWTSVDDIARLERMVAQGANETEVQNFLKPRGYLFDGLYRHGHGTYLFPEIQLGTYRADWLAANGSSASLEWQMIELECPQSKPMIRSGHFSDATRKGVNQIHDWRHWISDNKDYVAKSRKQHGLGLWGLNEYATGLVVVGSREKYKNDKNIDKYNLERAAIYKDSHIRVVSYESLIEDMKFRINRPAPRINIVGTTKEGRPIVHGWTTAPPPRPNSDD